jgi:hypothetical protein
MKKLLLLSLVVSPLFGMRFQSSAIVPKSAASAKMSARVLSAKMSARTFATHSENAPVVDDREVRQAIEIWKAAAGSVERIEAAQNKKPLKGPVLAWAAGLAGSVMVYSHSLPLTAATAVAAGSTIALVAGLIVGASRSDYNDRLRAAEQHSLESELPKLRSIFKDVDQKKWQKAQVIMDLAHGRATCEKVDSALHRTMFFQQ